MLHQHPGGLRPPAACSARRSASSRPIGFGRALALALLLFPCAGTVTAQPFDQVGNVAIDDGQGNAGRASAVAVVPGSATTLYLGASDGGVWRTTDGGTTWSTATDGFSSLRITAVGVDGTGLNVFAGTWRPVRLLRSTDGGASFSELVVPDLAYGGDQIWQILVDPANVGTLYMRTTRGLLRSTDNGTTWAVVLPPDTSFVDDVAILSSGGTWWVLATRGGLLYRSSSGNAGSFAAVALPSPTDGQPPFFGSSSALYLAPVPGSASVVYMAYRGYNEAIYLSTAYGSSPAFVSRHPRPLTATTFVASSDGTTLYSGELSSGNASINRGANGGLSWETPFGGPYHPDIWALETTAFPSYLYAATDGGLWRMDENANPPVWENLNGNLGTHLLYDVYASRSSKDAIIAGSQDNGPILYRGAGWKVADGGGGDAGDGLLRRDNPNIGVVYLVIEGNSIIYVNGDSATFPLNQDPNCPRPEGGTDFAADPADPLMVCTAVGGRIACGRGGRDSWCRQSADIGAHELVIVDSSHAWASTFGGHVMRTTTGVLGTWQDVTNDLPVGTVLDIDAPELGDPNRALVLAGTSTLPTQVYETTNGGANWIPRGVPPVANPGGVPPRCMAPPCPFINEPENFPLSFAVSFAGPLWSEAWYVGTDRGLLESGDGGATWHQTNLPRVQVNAIDSYRNIITVGTWGRGVWQRAFPDLPDVQIPAEYNFFPFLGHDPVGPIWASQVIDLSGGLIDEVRLLADGGRVYRSGEAAFGPVDFMVSPGTPFLMQASATAMLEFSGPPRSPQAVALQPGWNALGFVDSSLGLASEVVADAALQGISLGAVLDGSASVGYLPPSGTAAPGAEPGTGAAPASTDFSIEPASGYWVYACGVGGLWTPGGAFGSATSVSLQRSEEVSFSGGVEGGADGVSPEAATCPDLQEILDQVPGHLAARIPGEILACQPEQEVPAGADTLTLCDTPPPLTTDLRRDNVPCAGQPASRGCALTMIVTGVTRSGPGEMEVTFDLEAKGTATKADGTICPISAQASGAVMTVQVEESVAPPVLDLSVISATASMLSPVQSGCGSDEDDAIAGVVASAAEAALAQEVGLRLSGLGPVCSPDFPLPDTDGDGAVDCDDGCPADGAKVAPGLCGCGVVDDGDGDGVAACLGDCDDGDGSVWRRPGEVLDVTVTHEAATGLTTISWTPPLDPGAAGHQYDTLGAFSPGGFGAAGTCIESGDGSDTTAVTGITPGPGEALHILVRALNACPSEGTGSLGFASDGTERAWRTCP